MSKITPEIYSKLFGSWQAWIKVRDEAKEKGSSEDVRIANIYIDRIEKDLMQHPKERQKSLENQVLHFIEYGTTK